MVAAEVAAEREKNDLSLTIEKLSSGHRVVEIFLCTYLGVRYGKCFPGIPELVCRHRIHKFADASLDVL